MFPVHESVMGTDRYGKKHFPICVDEFSCRYARDRISVLERNSVFHFGEGEPRIEEYLITSSLPVFFEKDNPVLFFTLVIS